MRIGTRIYYDKGTGNILVNIGERFGYGDSVVPTTDDEDIANYTALSERNRESFDFIELEFGQYAQDFAESNGYRVNPTTKELEFSYTDPNEPEAPLVYQEPLSKQVEKLKQEDLNNKEAIAELYMLSMGGF